MTQQTTSEQTEHAAPREAWDAIAAGYDRYVAPQEVELANEALALVGPRARRADARRRGRPGRPCATHALLNEPALERIASSALECIIVTDTVPVDVLTKPPTIEVLSISGLLAETIQNVFADDAVSAIFAGENQLF